MSSEQAAPARYTFRCAGLRWGLRSIEEAPEKAVGILYLRDGEQFSQAGVGSVKDGCWVDGKHQPLDGDYYWVSPTGEGQ